jgi:hypothetical protein
VGTALAVDLSAEEGACAGAALEVAVDARGALCGATMRARGAPLHPAALQASPARAPKPALPPRAGLAWRARTRARAERSCGRRSAGAGRAGFRSEASSLERPGLQCYKPHCH